MEDSISTALDRLRILPPQGLTSPYMIVQPDVLEIFQDIMTLSQLTVPREVGVIVYHNPSDGYLLSPTPPLDGVGASDFRLGPPGQGESMFPSPSATAPGRAVLIVHTHPFALSTSHRPTGYPYGDFGADQTSNSDRLPLAIVWTRDGESVAGVTLYSRFRPGDSATPNWVVVPAQGGFGEPGRPTFDAAVAGANDGAAPGERAAFSFWLNAITGQL